MSLKVFALTIALAGTVACLAGCGAESAPSAQALAGEAERSLSLDAPAPAAAAPEPSKPGGGAKRERAEGKMMKKSLQNFGSKDNEAGILGAVAAEEAPAAPSEASGGEGRASAAAPTRAWFPETFLFEPLLQTDDTGRASIEVRVPDRLTTWRVLALAHSREGAQAGAETSFLGTLPTYVDPVVPPFLLAGDEIRLPIQVVNTTAEAVSTQLKLEVIGAQLIGGGAELTIPAGGSRVEYATLRTGAPGVVGLRAVLGSSDAIARSIPVEPTGRLVEQRFGGTLAAPRSLTVEGPAGLEAGSARVRLQVFPGALALLRSELSGAQGRGGVEADAHSLLLAGRAGELLTALGEVPDRDSLRSLGILAGQRVIRHARAPDPATAATLAEAALAHGQNPVLSRLGERMADQLARGQRPDGTCGGGSGWTLQRVLVATADCARAVRASQDTPRARQRAAGAAIKASGAFERNSERVLDAYTAAAILGSGAVQGSLAEKLRERVRGAVLERPDGSRYLPVEEGVVRPDGGTPSEVEATALAVLALDGDPKAPWRADLGATLLGAYSPAYGWGDGRTNLVALRAVLALFKEPLPKSVQLSLELDGKVVAEGTLDQTRLKDVATLASSAGGSGSHSWTIRAEPPVPGLGYSLTLQSWVPWEKEAPAGGLELSVEVPKELTVGRPAEVGLSAAAPAGLQLKIRQALPAGVQADSASLDALVSQGRISAFDTEDGAVTFTVAALAPGQTFQARYRVIPTLGGTLHAGASTIESPSRPGSAHHVPPVVWTVR